MEITIVSQHLNNDDLILKLENSSGWQPNDIKLVLKKPQHALRQIDATILVAIISATGLVLNTLIKGLLEVAKLSKSQKIVVKDEKGNMIECPIDCPIEKIDDVKRKIEEMDKVKIEI